MKKLLVLIIWLNILNHKNLQAHNSSTPYSGRSTMDEIIIRTQELEKKEHLKIRIDTYLAEQTKKAEELFKSILGAHGFRSQSASPSERTIIEKAIDECVRFMGADKAFQTIDFFSGQHLNQATHYVEVFKYIDENYESSTSPNLLRLAQSFITSDRKNQKDILKLLSSIPKKFVTKLATWAVNPTTKIIFEDRLQAYKLIAYLKLFPLSEWEHIIPLLTQSTAKLINTATDRKQIDCILDALHRLPFEMWDGIVGLLTNPCLQLVEGEDGSAMFLLRLSSRAHPEEISLRIARALMFMRGLPADQHVSRFNEIISSPLTKKISSVRKEDKYSVKPIVIHHLDLPEPLDGQAMIYDPRRFDDLRQIYAPGENVHKEDREIHTKKALELLWADTETLSQEMIKNNFEALLAYVRTLAHDKRSLAQKALGLEDGIGFGGFLKGEGLVTSYGLNTTAQELLARFWIFSHKGTSKDIMLKKEGIISALMESCHVDADGNVYVLCNPGKLQRLVVHVLQGYLKGVNIDGDVFDTSAPKPIKAPEPPRILVRREPPAQAAPQIATITQLIEIEQFLKPLFDDFEAKHPQSAKEVFERAFEYLYRLRMGHVRGAAPTLLDPREVIYILRMGINGDEISVASDFTDTFKVEDYKEQYDLRDQYIREEAAGDARSVLRSTTAWRYR